MNWNLSNGQGGIMNKLKTQRLKQKALLVFTICFGLSALSINPAAAQSDEIQQLLLNVEKLAQFKSILSDMKKGYTILSTGYNSVKNIAQGNFSLHEAFLDGLWLVSSEVRKYGRIVDIINEQAALVSEYKAAYRRFNSGGNFTVSELNYLSKIYSQLLKESLENLDQLAMVITANKMRMSDDERLQAIDYIYADTDNKLVFLRSFNRQTSVLNFQRQREKADVTGVKNYYNLK
ncbi:TerB family tellurite resistance protein [Mucilaginibacter sp. RCC_168]|uniref:TerB family tellurite resistance protein n=1 Tax=Mucilaginibacter sp. RCC_168 TaxID=3239221 RepID=UPI0035240187